MKAIDLHCDTIYRCFDENKSLFKNDCHISLERAQYLKKYIQCYAIWMPDEYRGEEAVAHFQKCFMKYLKEAKANKEIFTKALYADDFEQSDTGLYGLLTVEGGSALGGELTNIKYMFDCGVRIITLTWNGDNELAGGVGGAGSGLTDFGKETVREFEKIGIIPDVSHLHEKGFYDLAEICEKPFVATHSNLKRVCGHKRNLTDNQFEIIKKKGGIVGLNFARIFLENNGCATMDSLYKMTEAFMTLGGEKTLCLGGDLDGTDLPDNITGVESLESFYEYLLKKNYSEDLLDDIFYNNAYRFLKSNLPKRSI